MCGPVATAVGYFALAALAVAFARFSDGIAMAWTASALLAGRLIHLPERRWLPWLVWSSMASVLATGFLGLGWAAAIPFAFVNLSEATLAALLWRRITNAFWPYDTLEWIAAYYVGIVLTVPLLTGVLAAAVAWAIVGIPPIANFTSWIIAHSLGLLACLPIFHFAYSQLVRGRNFLPTSSQLPLAIAVLGFYAALLAVVFTLDLKVLLVLPLVYLLISAAALPGSITALLPLLLIGIGGGLTVNGQGPIAGLDIDFGTRIQFFQLYVGVSVFASFPISCERIRRVAQTQLSPRRKALL